MENEVEKSTRGKKPKQRMKSYLVLQYLLKNTDESHFENANSIVEYLDINGIQAERRSIYKDIEEINIAHIMLKKDYTFDQAYKYLERNPDKKMVKYKPKKGFYVDVRPLSLQNARLISECVYTSRFVSEQKAADLVEEICGFMSEHHQNEITHDMFAVDRLKANIDYVFSNVNKIHRAMSNNSTHIPQKISFKYIKYTLDGQTPKHIERRHGAVYTVSPYEILIDNGNYYLLGINDKSKDRALKTYRIDRMHNIKETGEPRIVTEDAKKLDYYIETYTQRVFSMYGGKKERVEIQFITPLLDAMVERFGTKNSIYSKVDERHYKINTEVEISPTFFGWLAGFGSKVKLLSPSSAIKGYKEHIKKICEKQGWSMDDVDSTK